MPAWARRGAWLAMADMPVACPCLACAGFGCSPSVSTSQSARRRQSLFYGQRKKIQSIAKKNLDMSVEMRYLSPQ